MASSGNDSESVEKNGNRLSDSESLHLKLKELELEMSTEGKEDESCFIDFNIEEAASKDIGEEIMEVNEIRNFIEGTDES